MNGSFYLRPLAGGTIKKMGLALAPLLGRVSSSSRGGGLYEFLLMSIGGGAAATITGSAMVTGCGCDCIGCRDCIGGG